MVDRLKKFLVNIWSFIKKRCWYLCLLIASSIYVYQNRTCIYQLKEFNAINLIFLLWLILLLLPLFSEVEFFGVKLKKEVEKVKGEVIENINDLKAQIVELKITNSSDNSQSVSIYQLPSEQEVIKTLKDINKEGQDKISEKEDSLDLVSDNSIYLFKVRLTLETIIGNICDSYGYEGPKNLNRMLLFIIKEEIIDRNTFDYIKQIKAICNRGIHGEIVSTHYIELVQALLPQVLHDLDLITSRMGFK